MSETSSSEININYLNSAGNKLKIDTPKITKPTSKLNEPSKKKQMTTDTDFYFNLLANPEKIKPNENKTVSVTSSRTSSVSSTDSRTSSSSKTSPTKMSFQNINFTDNNKKNVDTPPVFNEKINNPKFTPPQFTPPPKTNIPLIVEKKLTPQELKIKKIELLRRLSEIKQKGYKLSKEYNFDSSIEEMEYEYALLKSFADKQNGIKLYKTFLLNGMSVCEFLNDKYDPFDFKLTGWSEHMSIEVDNYDDILEEIYEKYRGVGRKMEPEFKLLFLIVSSAAAFHHSKSSFRNIPGLDKILEQNPTLLNKVVGQMMNNKTTESQFMTQQEINIENEKKRLQLERQQLRQQQQDFINQKKRFSAVNSSKKELPKIVAPNNVNEILNKIKNDNNLNKNNSNSRLMSESTINENDTTETKKRKRGRKKKKKISIAT